MAATKKRAGASRRGPGRPPSQGVHPAFDRDEQFQARKKALVEIAIHFFNSRGYHATSMEAIASEVGLTKGTLYHYYASKNELAYDCMLSSIEDGQRMAQQAAQEGGTGLAKLERYLTLQFETLAGQKGSSWLYADMSVLKSEHRADARRRSRAIDALVQEFVAEGVADGSIAPIDPKIAEFFLIGALNWLPRWYTPRGAMSSTDLAAVFIRMVFDGLRPRS